MKLHYFALSSFLLSWLPVFLCPATIFGHGLRAWEEWVQESGSCHHLLSPLLLLLRNLCSLGSQEFLRPWRNSGDRQALSVPYWHSKCISLSCVTLISCLCLRAGIQKRCCGMTLAPSGMKMLLQETMDTWRLPPETLHCKPESSNLTPTYALKQ